MGNSASQLPYSIDNQVGAPHDHNGWALHDGKSTDGNETEVSVFVGKKPLLAKQPVSPRFPQKTQLVPALHHYNHCRKLRHPHILKVLATLDTDNPTAASAEGAPTAAGAAESTSTETKGDLIVVTEPCISLDQWLLSNPEPEQLAWGLECVVQGLHFLHASAKLAHGNLGPSSFYVTRSGDVKLWNFSLITQIGPNLGPSNHFREWEQAVTPESYRSPERVQQNYSGISNAGIHAIDSFGLGVLINHWFQGHIPAALQKAVQRLQTPNIKMRPRLQPLLKCPVFDTPYQKLQKQFEEIVIQPVEHKVSLWQNLGLSLQAGLIPEALALYKVLPLIQTSIKTTCTNESLISQELYRREVMAMITPMFHIIENNLEPSKVSKLLSPLVALLFQVKDRGVRGTLLNKVSFMSEHLDKNSLNSSVFEPLCSGFNDSSPALRELTLKATLGLVPYLSAPNMEKLSRYLVRLQSDTETSIRTNSVIFIAKIAPSLTEIARDKMLLPAYARAMKDTFSPCRLSAIQSLEKNQDLFSKKDLAAKVLPTISPLLMDPMADVRNEAFRALKQIIRVLEQESNRLAHIAQRQAAEQQQQPQNQPQSQPQSSAPPLKAQSPATAPAKPAPAPSSGSYLSGFSSWMSSSAKPETPVNSATVPAAPAPAPLAPTPAAYRPAAPLPMAAGVPPAQQFASTSLSAPAPAPVAPAADDGWGDDDDDGWGDDDDDMEDPFANIGTKTVTASTTTKKPALSGFGGGVTDEDPFASIGMKTSSATLKRPKGKLSLPKKSGGGIQLNTAPAAPAATKLKMDASELSDGWDDF